MPRTILVPHDNDAQDISPPSLEGCEIHAIWDLEAFRYANYSAHLSVDELDKEEYDFPDLLYNRAKPALRLATLFLEKILPHLTVIHNAPILEQLTDRGERFAILDPAFRPTEDEVTTFERDLLGYMCTTYRFTLLGASDAKQGVQNGCRTYGMPDDRNSEFFNELEPVHAQTAISTDWLWLLTCLDWDEMPHEEKYGKLFLLATNLIHELAHAVWITRSVRDIIAQGHPLVEIASEPRFHPDLASVPELGYEIELALFGGLPNIPNLGSLSVVEKPCGEGHSYRVPFNFINDQGHVTSIHQISRHAIWRFFATKGNPLWTGSKLGDPFKYRKRPDFALEILEDDAPLRRSLSTELSCPQHPCYAPTFKMPDPRRLGPAITADNELVDRDSEGKLPPQKKSKVRELKTRIRMLASTSGEWWIKSPVLSP